MKIEIDRLKRQIVRALENDNFDMADFLMNKLHNLTYNREI